VPGSPKPFPNQGVDSFVKHNAGNKPYQACYAKNKNSVVDRVLSMRATGSGSSDARRNYHQPTLLRLAPDECSVIHGSDNAGHQRCKGRYIAASSP